MAKKTKEKTMLNFDEKMQIICKYKNVLYIFRYCTFNILRTLCINCAISKHEKMRQMLQNDFFKVL